jgi:DNA polymerase-1
MEIKLNRDAYELFHKGTLALQKCEQNGMRVDVPYMESMKVKLTKRINKAKRDIQKTELGRLGKKEYGEYFNIGSTDHLSKILFQKMGLKSTRFTKTGKPSLDEASMEALKVDGIPEILKIRKLEKLRDVYLGGFLREQVDGIVHPFFNLSLVTTYRSSSDSPNFQNIPKRDPKSMAIIRRAILPTEGNMLFEADISGVEVTTALCYHKDSNMFKYLTTEGSDMHGDVCSDIFKIKYNPENKEHKYMRSATKNGFVFPQFYGDYYANNAKGLSEWMELPHKSWGGENVGKFGIGSYLSSKGIKSYKSFENHIKDIEYDFWNNRFSEYGRWKKRWVKLYEKNGYVESFTGFRYSGIMERNKIINYPVQGAAFHCLLWILIRVSEILEERGFKTKIIGQIHDAIIFDVYPPELEELGHIISHTTSVALTKAWPWLIIPLKMEGELCGINESWDKKVDYQLPSY